MFSDRRGAVGLSLSLYFRDDPWREAGETSRFPTVPVGGPASQTGRSPVVAGFVTLLELLEHAVAGDLNA